MLDSKLMAWLGKLSTIELNLSTLQALKHFSRHYEEIN